MKRLWVWMLAVVALAVPVWAQEPTRVFKLNFPAGWQVSGEDEDGTIQLQNGVAVIDIDTEEQIPAAAFQSYFDMDVQETMEGVNVLQDSGPRKTSQGSVQALGRSMRVQTSYGTMDVLIIALHAKGHAICF